MHQTRIKPSLLVTLVAALTAAAVPFAASAAYPEKAIVIVVPFSAGGPSDKIARDLAEALRKPLGQTVIVENTVGAGGTIGAARVARAQPDGYTFLVHHIGLATAPALYKNIGYKTEELEFVGLINEAPSTLIGRPTLQPENLGALRSYIAQNGAKLNLANAGVGSASHLCGLLLQNTLKSNMTFVPYKGTAPAMTDLIGGQVDLMCEQATNSAPQIEGKKVKVYGISSAKRLDAPALAQVPTLDEAGLKGFTFNVWHGVYAPKGTPQAVVAKVNEAMHTALKDPSLVSRWAGLGITVVSDNRSEPAGHKRFVQGEMTRWAKVIKEAGIEAE